MPIDFFRVAPSALLTTVGRELLRSGLSPFALRTNRLPFVEPHVSHQWHVGLQAKAYSQAASRLLTSCSVTTLWTPGQIASTLQHAAGTFLSLGQISFAHRCLQEAIGHLANGGPPASVESDLQRWTLLAAVAVSKKELESARLWLRQASRTLTGNASELSSHVRSHYLGDLLAIQACLLFETGDIHSASGTLDEAARAHRQSGSMLSVAADLILKSRCVPFESSSPERSQQRLTDAIEIIKEEQSNENELLTQHLLGIASSDLKQLCNEVTPQQAASWN